MNDPVRLRIQKAICAAIEEIQPADGYHFDLRPTPSTPVRCYRGRLFLGQESALPFVTVLESPVPPDRVPEPTPSPHGFGIYELTLQGFGEDDILHASDPAQFLLADLTRRMALLKSQENDPAGLFGLDGIVSRLQIGWGTARPADDVSATAYVVLPVTLEMYENWTDPYA